MGCHGILGLVLKSWQLYTTIDVNILNINDKEFEDNYEKTALYLAIEKDYIEIAKLLISNDNIDLNIINKNVRGEQETVIQLAMKKNDEIIKLITEKNNL